MIASDRSELPPELPTAASAEPELYCPKCSYILTGVEHAGLDCCPECGEKVDFADLRRLAQMGLDLSHCSYWRLAFRVPPEFKAALKRPGYVVRLPPRPRSFFIVTGLLLLLALAGAALTALSMIIGFLVYVTLAAVSYAATWLWARWLLRRAGHREPATGAGHVLFVAAAVCFPIAINLALFTVSIAFMLYAHHISLFPHVRDELAIVLGGFLVLAPLVFHFVLWSDWSQMANLMLLYEMRRQDSIWPAPLLRRFDPATAIMMVTAPLAIFVLLFLGSLL
jgi:hypothetical protein